MRPRSACPRRSPAAAALPCAAALLLAAAAAAVPAQADSFTYSADSVSMRLASGAQHALLSGNARVATQDLRITAHTIELYGKDFIYARCRGGVKVVDAARGLEITSEELFYDRGAKVARVKGAAVMVDLKNEIVAKGGYIEDRDADKVTFLQVGVRIFRRDIECKAEFARYERETNVLELSGMPWVTRSGDEYTGTRITIDLDTEEISAEGGVSGTIRDRGAAGGDDAAP